MNFKIGIIGAGLIADFHAKAIGDIENASVVGFCDGGSGKSKELAEKYHCKSYSDFKAIIDDDEVNMITIASSSGVHMEPAVYAAEKGVHVLCEKPIEITLERIDKMISAHQKEGTYLGGIFNFRFDVGVKYILKALEEERFGKISFAGVHVPWWRDAGYYKDSWHGTQKLDGGGALMNQSIHMIDLLQHLMGSVKSLKAYTATLAHNIETEDTGVAALQFENGALGVIHGTTAAWPGQSRKIDIMGSKGSVTMVDDVIKVWEFTDEKEYDKEIKNMASVRSEGGASNPGSIAYINHKLNIEAFIQAIEKGEKFSIDGHESRKAVEIILAIYNSSKTGKEIVL